MLRICPQATIIRLMPIAGSGLRSVYQTPKRSCSRVYLQTKLGVRSIRGFNERIAEADENGEQLTRTVQTGFDKETGQPVYETQEIELEHMPFIVVVIDEMADLMMVAGKDIEILRGDYNDPDSLLAAMRGAYGVFYYSGFSRNEVGEGINVIEAAKAAGVKHFVYSSGAAAAPGKGMEGAAKMQVEFKLRDSGVPFSVLRPVAFMENFRGQQARTAEKGVVDSRDSDRLVYFIAIRDIGFFSGEAFDHPDAWLGRGEDVAGDQMSLAGLTAIYSDVMGRDIEYVQLPLDEYLATFPPPLRPLFRWYDEAGYSVDTAGLRKQYPNLITLEQYLRETGWEDWEK